MQVNVLTIFPQTITAYTQEALLGKAHASGLLNVTAIDIRDFTTNKHRKVDDEPFGGGSGMVMLPQPIFDAIDSLKLKKGSRVIMTTPQGKPFSQALAQELAQESELTIICGRYEGVDQRVIEQLVTDEISIGDYVLTGGELPALVMIDAISRMIPGIVGKQESVENDSFYAGKMLDWPHYTRPAEFRGLSVPTVLLEGNHAKIEAWRQEQAYQKTKQVRPDLLKN